MKKTIFFLTVTLLASLALAQSQTATAPAESPGKPLPELLSWMVGQWEGQGTSHGDQEFAAKLSVSSELDDTALMINRESLDKTGMLSGGKKELMLVGYSGSTQKIVMTLYTSKNYIGIYVGELKSGTNEISFSNTTLQPGYTDRRTFKTLPDGSLSFFIEQGSPDKEVSKAVEVTLKKKM